MADNDHPTGHPGGGHPGRPGEHPGSHPRGDAGERGGSFERQYAEGTPPWDIGKPQPEIVALEEAGTFGQVVLEVGCGTGENALFLASRCHIVQGIDAAPAAIEQAREKAAKRGLDAGFIIGDVLEVLPTFDVTVDAVIDVGFFHALTDEQRITFARGLAHVLAPDGVYAMLCFSDRVPGDYGPRRVSEAEIRATFSGPEFRVREVRPAELLAAVPQMPILDANLALVERV